MNNLFTAICIFNLAFFISNAQEKLTEKPNEFVIDTTSVLSIDNTIKTLYSVISGEKGEQRNWKQFKHLFAPNAKLILAGEDESGDYKTHFMAPQDYIKTSGKWLVEHGFLEKEIHRKIEVFGNIAHVFSTYESYHSKTDEDPFMRGINSIQLFNDGKRWWIINIYWTNETRHNPIPRKYLP